MSEISPPHPARLFCARVVYWSIWGPAVAIAIPFVLIERFVDFLDFKLFPWTARVARPAWGLTHEVALFCGNAVLGKPKTPA